MKKLILDTPFRDSFPDFLEKGETIVWEGKPSLKSDSAFSSDPEDYNNYDRHAMVAVFIIGLIFLLTAEDTPYVAWFSFIVLTFLAVILPAWMRKIKKNYSYAITQKQIIFQFKKNWFGKNNFHTILLSEIKDVIVVMKYDIEKMEERYAETYEAVPVFYQTKAAKKIGTIFLVPRHPQMINFETTNLSNNDKRHQPTLELLEDANAVAKIIREGIRNHKI